LKKLDGRVLAFLKLYNRVSKPFDYIILKDKISRQNDDKPLNPRLFGRFLVTGFFVDSIATFVIVVDCAGLTGAADADHHRAAFPAEKFSRQYVFLVRFFGGGLMFIFLHVDVGTPIITVEHLGEYAITRQNLPLVSATDKFRLDAYVLNEGDIVFSRVGSVDRNAYITAHENGWLFSGRLLRIRPFKNGNVDSKYLSYYFKFEPTKARVRGIAVGQTMASLNTKLLNSFSIVLPPLPEQRRIAEALSDTDALIAALEKLIAKKRAIKQGAMQELLTDKRRLPGFSGEWVETTLGKVALDIKTGKRNNEDKADNGKYAFFVRSQQVERINTYSYDCEAILVPGEGNIGQIFHYIKGKFDCHQRVYKISDFVDVNPIFIYHYLVMFFGKYALINTVKATVDSLRLPTFVNFVMNIPATIKEQTAIAEILSDMDAEINALTAKLNKVRNIKQGMMSELLPGRIRLMEQETCISLIDEEKIIIAGIVNAFYHPAYTLGRKKVQKLFYLFRRHRNESTAGFKEKVAGPYDEKLRYVVEPEAVKSGYIITESNELGTKFSKGASIQQAIDSAGQLGFTDSFLWLGKHFLKTSGDELELLTTVDWTKVELAKKSVPVRVDTVKNYIERNEEWKDKLKRELFSDHNIARAIKWSNDLFGGENGAEN